MPISAADGRSPRPPDVMVVAVAGGKRTMTGNTERNAIMMLWAVALLAAGAIVFVLFWV
jgi:hypothetical protein